MKKFIRGTFELDKNVVDLIKYEKEHEDVLNEIIDWANDFGVEIKVGTSEDNTYLVEYKVIGNTLSYCKGIVAELKSMLKKEWKKTESIFQANGDVLW